MSLESVQEHAVSEAKDYTDLYVSVKKLPKDMRMAVVLYYAEGFSVKEIATIEDTIESSVKNRLYKARIKLKDMLNEQEVYSI